MGSGDSMISTESLNPASKSDCSTRASTTNYLAFFFPFSEFWFNPWFAFKVLFYTLKFDMTRNEILSVWSMYLTEGFQAIVAKQLHVANEIRRYFSSWFILECFLSTGYPSLALNASQNINSLAISYTASKGCAAYNQSAAPPAGHGFGLKPYISVALASTFSAAASAGNVIRFSIVSCIGLTQLGQSQRYPHLQQLQWLF